MKHLKIIIAAIAIVTCDDASASCEERILTKFQEYRTEAIRVNVPLANLQTVQARIKPASDSYFAIYHYNYGDEANAIWFGQNMCELPVDQQDSIIAHELGHVIAIEQDESKSEQLADMYGARLLDQTKRENLLALLDQHCETGSNFYCRQATAWRWGMTH